MSVAEAVTLGIAIMGIAGVIFTALRYNRDDTTALVGQQNALFGELKVLNDELRITVDRLRAECDDCLAKLRGSGGDS